GALPRPRRAGARAAGHAGHHASAGRRDEGDGASRGRHPDAGSRAPQREDHRGGAGRGGADPQRDPDAPAPAPPAHRGLPRHARPRQAREHRRPRRSHREEPLASTRAGFPDGAGRNRRPEPGRFYLRPPSAHAGLEDPATVTPTTINPVHWADNGLVLLDQTLLPSREVERRYERWEDVAGAIRTLVVRGAPAIGVAAAFGVALAARQSRAMGFDGLIADLELA